MKKQIVHTHTKTDEEIIDLYWNRKEDAIPETDRKYGKYLYAASMPVAKENVFCAGVTLGTVEKRRFVPHPQLFKCYGDRFMRKLELTLEDKRVMQYLSGAEIDCDLADGWAVVTLCGLPLGGIKVSGGRGKNHYPKGLRVNGL